MNFVNVPLLAASVVVFACLVFGLFSARIGLSFLLVFLVAGMLVGEDGPGGYQFDDFGLSFWVGNVALAVILLDGGLRTPYSTFRTGLKPSLALATVGVLLTALITGAAAVYLLGVDWIQGLLLGAVVGSTDAAAVFSLLKTSKVTLNERVSATLQIESGTNDPMAVYLTLALIALALARPRDSSAVQMLSLNFAQQFVIGGLLGAAGALGAEFVLRRLPTEADGGLLALLLVSAGLAVFSAAGVLGGSGFLAVYLFGLMVGNRMRHMLAPALSAMDGYAWLSQAGMFLLLGLLVTPSAVLDVALPALGVAAVLMLVARPIAVWACLAPFRFNRNEVWFISWVGLRGAVPIVLAVFPLMAGVQNAMLLFNVAFMVVLTSLLLQGTTLAWAGQKLSVALPEPSDERRARAVFGDFVVDASAPVGALFAFYGLPQPPSEHISVETWMRDQLGTPPIVGDCVRNGPAIFSVRGLTADGHIALVGLRIEDASVDPERGGQE